MATLNHNVLTLNHLPNDIQENKVIVLEAVMENGWAFEFYSLEVQGDCDVVLEEAENKISSLQRANLTSLVRDNTTSPPIFLNPFML